MTVYHARSHYRQPKKRIVNYIPPDRCHIHLLSPLNSRSILSEKSDSAAALTSFTAPPSETKDWMMTLTKEHRPTKEPRPEKDSELYWERNIESCVDVNGRETDDDDDDKTKDEGSTGSDISEELDEEEVEERDEECGRGDVVLDFQSEGGSFKNSAGSRFERNWRSESEKMTGSSYV